MIRQVIIGCSGHGVGSSGHGIGSSGHGVGSSGRLSDLVARFPVAVATPQYLYHLFLPGKKHHLQRARLPVPVAIG